MKDTESYWAVLSRSTVYYAVQGHSDIWLCGWNPHRHCVTKATEQYFPEVLFINLYKVDLTLRLINWNSTFDY